MRCLLVAILFVMGGSLTSSGAEPLPFGSKIEFYRAEEEAGGAIVFCLRLEQPFLAEEFEKSNFLRLQAVDDGAYLIYPKETTFHQKHAEFYGRLRGAGAAKLRLSYEIVSENLDGSRRVEVRESDLEAPIPAEPTGSEMLFKQWAEKQNAYFSSLLGYYPEESFFQYVLLQSQQRYGVQPPPLAVPQRQAVDVETDLYQLSSGSLAIQEALQRQTLSGSGPGGDLNIHISNLRAPALRSLDYERLLKKRQDDKKSGPQVHEISKLVPQDYYLLHFNSMQSAGELMDLTTDWGDSLLRLFVVQARDNRLQDKLEDQLCVRRGPLTKLFADAVIAEMAVTGSDPFVLEGADVTLILRLKQPEVFETAAAGWLEESRKEYPEMVERDFNYRGHKVAARYTPDRVVSSFMTLHEEYAIISNSHRAIRTVIDAASGVGPPLRDALDYRYVTALLPPEDKPTSGYFFASEGFIKRLVGPAAKISEKRRIECFNNLVMLNNASLFYRLENGKSPESLTELVEGRFIDANKVVCPHGGAYAFDNASDTCTCSLHNRLKHLTPNSELTVLNVSAEERDEYNRYKERYLAFWQRMFDPIAIRIDVQPRVKLEVCVLPLANGSAYTDLRESLGGKSQPLSSANIAPSAVVSCVATPGRESIANFLRQIPGVQEALEADPTLTDLSWLGDRAGVHFCDDHTILEIDPTRIGQMDVPMIGQAPVGLQFTVAGIFWGLNLPAYVAVEVEDREKAARLLDELATRIFLKKGELVGLHSALDAYRLPDYKEHAVYVLSYQVYAMKLRLHVALIGDELVAATRPETLREVIDASAVPAEGQPRDAQLLMRINRKGLNRLNEDLQLYWAEKSRLACHRNSISIYNLLKLYNAPIEEVPKVSERMYGVRYFCPEHGVYHYDAATDQVVCDVHGNRQHSRQELRVKEQSSFARFVESIDEIVVTLRYEEDALMTTVEIARSEPKKADVPVGAAKSP